MDYRDVIIREFDAWLEKDGIHLLQAVKQESEHVRSVMDRLRMMDVKTHEFTDCVLYDLLPNSLRHSCPFTPGFSDIRKARTRAYGYSDKDWNCAANLIFSLSRRFQDEPEKIEQWISEFAGHKYRKGFQSGLITPVLFCIDCSFPVIDGTVVRTYNDCARINGWGRMSARIGRYTDSREKCHKLIDFLEDYRFKDLALFGRFCYWYARSKTDFEDYLRKAESEKYKDQMEQDEIIKDTSGMTPLEIYNRVINYKHNSSETVLYRGIRRKRYNANLAHLKMLFGFRCRICDERILKKGGGYYADAAHITAKGKGGTEEYKNIMILCPNHHKEFDYGAVEIIERADDHISFVMNGTRYEVHLRPPIAI